MSEQESGGPTPEEESEGELISPKPEKSLETMAEEQIKIWNEKYKGISQKVCGEVAPLLSGETTTLDDWLKADSIVDEHIRSAMADGRIDLPPTHPLEKGLDWGLYLLKRQIAADICLGVPLQQIGVPDIIKDKIRFCFEGQALSFPGWDRRLSKKFEARIKKMIAPVTPDELSHIRKFAEASEKFSEKMEHLILNMPTDATALGEKYPNPLMSPGENRVEEICNIWRTFTLYPSGRRIKDFLNEENK